MEGVNQQGQNLLIYPFWHYGSRMTIQDPLQQNLAHKEQPPSKDIVLKVYMHCDACANKVKTYVKVLEGVEDVLIDRANNKVTVKGSKADPKKVLNRIQTKFSRNVELISPKPNSGNEDKKKEEKKKPPSKSIELKMFMHCDACAQEIKMKLLRMKGIESVQTNRQVSKVTVNGTIDPKILVEKISRRMGKYAEIVNQGTPKVSENNESRIGDNAIQVPVQYNNCAPYMHPWQLLSDENVNSCSIM